MALYSAMFSQYNVSTAQVLVNKSDFYNEYTRENLQATLNELLELNIVPILNTNDAIAPPPEKNVDIQGVISIKDNDSLAARLAVLIDSDLLLIMSDVDGLFNKPPNEIDSRLLHTFSPKFQISSVNFGDSKSKVGTGGMQSKVQAANWALENNCSVVICNGSHENAIMDTINGKRIGTFFANVAIDSSDVIPIETQTLKGYYLSFSIKIYNKTNSIIQIIVRDGGRTLQSLTSEQRSAIIEDYAKRLLDNSKEILEANKIDLDLAKKNSKIKFSC